MKKQLLNLLLAALLTTSASAQTIYMSENFSSETLPAGWSNDSLGLPSTLLWSFTDDFQRYTDYIAISATPQGFDSSMAIFDSDQGSVNDATDELASLTTSDIDVSAATSVYLNMDEQYRPLAGPGSFGSSRRIEMSADGGSTWTTVIYDSTGLGYPDPVRSTYDLSAAAGVSNLRIRFTWTGSWDWWWAIDNIEVSSSPVGVIELNQSNVSVYPTLTNGLVNVKSDLLNNLSGFSVTDITGKRMDVSIQKVQGGYQFNFEKLSDGLYILSIRNNGEGYAQKIALKR